MGSMGPRGGIKQADVAICTIEKANGIINRLVRIADKKKENQALYIT